MIAVDAASESQPWNQHPPPATSKAVVTFRDGQFLGRGASKTVTVRVKNNVQVALACGNATDLIQELALMMSLKPHPHPHVLSLIAHEYDALSKVRMVLPIAKYGSVLDLVDDLEFEGKCMTHAHAGSILLQVSYAVLHLNRLGVDHGDVAGRNVLVFEFDVELPLTTQVKLGDFGEARPGRASPDCIRCLARELDAFVPR